MYVINRDPSSSATSSIGSANSLFNKRVPICLRGVGHTGEKFEELLIRVLLGTEQAGQSKVLHVQVTSESDPFFLHHLEVSEDEFQALKVEQSILVTFSKFPENLIALLEECICCRGQQPPKFLAVLRLGDVGEFEGARLGIVETNEFKHLSHISLSLKPGDDATIKQFLAGRLADLRSERNELVRSNGEMSSKLGDAVRELETCTADLLRQKAHSSKAEESTQAKLDELAANLKLASVKELETTKKKMESEHHAAQVGLRSTIETITVQNAELDKQVCVLIDTKYKLDSRLSDVSSRASNAERELQLAREEVARLQNISAELNKDWHLRDKTSAQHSIRVEWLEQQLKSKEEMITVLNDRLNSSESHLVTAENALEVVRASSARAEERVSASGSEIRKGNQIIERLQAELRSAKTKAKLKAAVITQQEALLQERQEAMKQAAQKHKELVQNAESSQKETQSLRTQLENQQKQLEESQVLLASNQQMIQWLNSQLNVAQIGRLGNMRHSRPTSGLLSTSVNHA